MATPLSAFPKKIIGYEEQRNSLDAALKTGTKFILIEGDFGSGKTLLIYEAMEKYPSIRIIEGTEEELSNQVKNQLLKEGFLTRIFNSLKGTRFDVFDFLSTYDKPLVVFFDENHALKKIILKVKNVFSDNPNLQAVVASTTTQKILLFDEYPEVANRFSAVAHIKLDGGLTEEQIDEIIRPHIKNIPRPISEGVVQFAKRKYNTPGKIMQALTDFNTDAQKKKVDKIDESLIPDYKPPTEILVPEQAEISLASGMTPLAQEVLKLIEEHKATGITPSEIAEKLKTTPGTVYVKLTELKKGKLVFKSGRKMFPYLPKNPEGLGA